MNRTRNIYLDHSATTAMEAEVIAAMQPFFSTEYAFGNPGRSHWAGIAAKQAIDHARQQTGDLINASPDEIVFTSGATESVNHAIKGVAFAYLSHPTKNQIVTSSIEHPCALASCAFLAEYLGMKVTEIPVDQYGVIDMDFAKNAINTNTFLVNIILSSHEIGTIQPVKELIDIAHANGVLVHVDATCAVGKLPVDVQELNCDLLSFSGHKFYGPKGVGVLYVKKSIQNGLADDLVLPDFVPLIHGSAVKGAFRSGTPNVIGIVGLGKACELAKAWNTEQNRRALSELTQYFWDLLHCALGDKVIFNGHPDPTQRVCNILNVSFIGYTGEALLSKLDKIAASSGPKTEHVLTQLGRKPEIAKGGIRFSLGRHTSREQIQDAVEHIKQVYEV